MRLYRGKIPGIARQVVDVLAREGDIDVLPELQNEAVAGSDESEAPKDVAATVENQKDEEILVSEELDETAGEQVEGGIMTVDNRSERQSLIGDSWNTDWNRHTVRYEELIALLPVRDGIPACH